MTNWYFILNNNHPDLASIRSECFLRHAIATNNSNDLSEVVSFDGTERLIKVAGVDEAWMATQLWINDAEACIGFYSQHDPEGFEVIKRWSDAQEPDFDSPEDEDELPDTPEQRRSWWQQISRFFN